MALLVAVARVRSKLHRAQSVIREAVALAFKVHRPSGYLIEPPAFDQC